MSDETQKVQRNVSIDREVYEDVMRIAEQWPVTPAFSRIVNTALREWRDRQRVLAKR